jgi:hypothetical protein
VSAVVSAKRHGDGRARFERDSRPWSWLEQFDRVPVWIEQLNLFAARTGDNIAPKLHAAVLHNSDHRRQACHREHDPIPSTGFLLLTIR